MSHVSGFIGTNQIFNAFNLVHRTAVPHFPSPLCSVAPTVPPPSAWGVQQGDRWVRSSLPWPFTRSFRRPAEQRRLVTWLHQLLLLLPRCGSVRGYRSFLSSLVDGFRCIGLEVDLDKTEINPRCTSSQPFGPTNFLGCWWNGSARFLCGYGAMSPASFKPSQNKTERYTHRVEPRERDTNVNLIRDSGSAEHVRSRCAMQVW